MRRNQNIDTQIMTAIFFIQKVPELKQKCIVKGSEIDILCKIIENQSHFERGEKLDKGIYIY